MVPVSVVFLLLGPKLGIVAADANDDDGNQRRQCAYDGGFGTIQLNVRHVSYSGEYTSDADDLFSYTNIPIWGMTTKRLNANRDGPSGRSVAIWDRDGADNRRHLSVEGLYAECVLITARRIETIELSIVPYRCTTMLDQRILLFTIIRYDTPLTCA